MDPIGTIHFVPEFRRTGKAVTSLSYIGRACGELQIVNGWGGQICIG